MRNEILRWASILLITGYSFLPLSCAYKPTEYRHPKETARIKELGDFALEKGWLDDALNYYWNIGDKEGINKSLRFLYESDFGKFERELRKAKNRNYYLDDDFKQALLKDGNRYYERGDYEEAFRRFLAASCVISCDKAIMTAGEKHGMSRDVIRWSKELNELREDLEKEEILK